MCDTAADVSAWRHELLDLVRRDVRGFTFEPTSEPLLEFVVGAALPASTAPGSSSVSMLASAVAASMRCERTCALPALSLEAKCVAPFGTLLFATFGLRPGYAPRSLPAIDWCLLIAEEAERVGTRVRFNEEHGGIESELFCDVYTVEPSDTNAYIASLIVRSLRAHEPRSNVVLALERVRVERVRVEHVDNHVLFQTRLSVVSCPTCQ